MTIDERAAKLNWDLSQRLFSGQGEETPKQIITRHIREAVAERDALLREADGLFEMGVWYGDYKARFLSSKAEQWEEQANEVRERITAMIGEQA